MKNAMLAGAVVLTMAAAPIAAQKSTAHKTVSDEHFVTTVLQDGMAEVELGKMAADKAASDQVKQFGRRMADDHSKAGDELKAMAQKKNMTAPGDLDAKHKALRDRLTKLSGEGFDRAYMQAMANGHREAVNLFRTESKSGKDPEIKEWASKTLPTIEEHLKQAQEISRSAVGTTGTMKPKK